LKLDNFRNNNFKSQEVDTKHIKRMGGPFMMWWRRSMSLSENLVTNDLITSNINWQDITWQQQAQIHSWSKNNYLKCFQIRT